jgi:hypothetical protein
MCDIDMASIGAVVTAVVAIFVVAFIGTVILIAIGTAVECALCRG